MLGVNGRDVAKLFSALSDLEAQCFRHGLLTGDAPTAARPTTDTNGPARPDLVMNAFLLTEPLVFLALGKAL